MKHNKYKMKSIIILIFCAVIGQSIGYGADESNHSGNSYRRCYSCQSLSVKSYDSCVKVTAATPVVSDCPQNCTIQFKEAGDGTVNIRRSCGFSMNDDDSEDFDLKLGKTNFYTQVTCVRDLCNKDNFMGFVSKKILQAMVTTTESGADLTVNNI